ncbi:MAG: protein kinase [Deltaproteobacteria bacterium]|nr:protein kinase [Deltaproteobacteria bacterium]
MIGEVIGNYRIVAVLGEGGMGVVYRAEHVQLGKPVAIKVIQPDISSDPTMVQRFFTEARAASSIDHPGIVEVHDYGTHRDGRAYLVMSLLTGESLEARLARGPLPCEEAATIVAQAAAALAAAHARGIVHRDLKPDNLFLVPNELVPGGLQVRLLDFGIAKLASDRTGPGPHATLAGALVGTPAYMSPEQCMGQSDLDHRTDLYALGGILFHALCGRPPFGGELAAGAILAAHMLDPVPAPRSLVPEIPPALEAIVLRALEKEPDARYQSANELRDALVHAGARTPLTRPPPGDIPDQLAPTVRAPRSTKADGPVHGPTIGETVVSMAPAAPAARRSPSTPTTSGGSAEAARRALGRLRAPDRHHVAGGGALGAVIAAAVVLSRSGGGADEPRGVATAPGSAQRRADPVEIPCPVGQIRGPDTGHHCCWPGQVWAAKQQRCAGTPECPPGQIADDDEDCVGDERLEARPPADLPPDLPRDLPRDLPVPSPSTGHDFDIPSEKAPALSYAPADVRTSALITVTFAQPITSPATSRAWIAISETGAPARLYHEWAFVDHGATTAKVRAPNTPGTYELRLYTNYPTEPHNLVRVLPIQVAASATGADPHETPRAQQRFTVDPVQRASELAEVRFPVPMRAAVGERFWVTIVPETAVDTAWQLYRYVATDARAVRLQMPSRPGGYEIRLHANYPTRMTNVVHRVRVRVEEVVH